MDRNRALIHDFYAAFEKRDAEKMMDCYHNEIKFEDPVFGKLERNEPGLMWKMLLESSKDQQLKIVYRINKCENDEAIVEWDAHYVFQKTQRKIFNKIVAVMRFEDGKIIYHKDEFDLYHWICMAFGFKGKLLGWTFFFQNKVREKAQERFAKYKKKVVEVSK